MTNAEWSRLIGLIGEQRQALEAAIAAGARRPFIRFRFIGRFAALPLTGAVAVPVCKENRSRVALMGYDIGTGNVYLTDEAKETSASRGWVLLPGDKDALSSAPVAPQNALYAVADAGHDLYLAELVAEFEGQPR
jgi:hypothetical protein